MSSKLDNMSEQQNSCDAADVIICRVCMCLKQPMYPIFNPSSEDDYDTKIMRCADVKIEIKDGLPDTICGECISKLNVALIFRDTCENADRYLRKLSLDPLHTDTAYADIKKEVSDDGNDADYIGEAFVDDEEEDSCSLLLLKNPTRKQLRRAAKKEKSCRKKLSKRKAKEKLRKAKIPKEEIPDGKQNGLVDSEHAVETRDSCPPEPKKRRRRKKEMADDLTDGVDSNKPIKNKKLHICEVCGRALSHSVSLKSHMLIHQGELPFQCTLCPHRSRLAWSLKIHMRVHAGEKPFGCALCPRTFLTASNRSRHMMMHQQVKPFQCDMCDKAYAGKSSLDDHKAIVHIGFKRHSCDVCGERYPSRKSLRNHMLFKHQIIPKRRSLALPPPKSSMLKAETR